MGNFFSNLMANSFKLILGILVAAVVIILWQNFETFASSTRFSLFVYAREYPLWIWLLIVFLGGNLFWFLVSYKSKMELKKDLKITRKENLGMRDELDKMRNQILSELPEDSILPSPEDRPEGDA